MGGMGHENFHIGCEGPLARPVWSSWGVPQPQRPSAKCIVIAIIATDQR